MPELCNAASSNNMARVRRCLARGDDVEGRDERSTMTPLIKAAMHKDPSLLLLLLHHRADIEARDGRGETALHRAADTDKGDCVRVLTALGAHVNAADNTGETPVSRAAQWGNTDAARALIEAGADLGRREKGGTTTLNSAQQFGHRETVALLTDPEILHLGDCSMSDEEFLTRLQSLPHDMRYRVLLLQGNRLTRVPDLTQHPQFSQLQVLNMAHNKLTEVREEHLPASVRTLYLSHNHIRTMSPLLVRDWVHSYFHMMCNNRQTDRRQVILHSGPIVADIQQKVEEGAVFDIYGSFHDTPRVDRLPDLSHMETVREVILPFQDITHIDGTHFPVDVENINFSYNMIEDVTHIKELKCLRKISLSGNKLKSMPEFPEKTEHLDVSNNEIVVIFRLSVSLKSLNLTGNPIRTLHRYCFPSEEVYELVWEALIWEQTNALQQPPPQIFKRDYDAVIQYYDQADMSHLIDNYSNRLAVVGEASAGKTSLVQTLIHGVPRLTGVEDRTEVVQTHTWRLPDGCTYQVFDQGGQKIYGITNRFFLCKESKNLICHNIKEGSIDTATEILKNILHQFPNGHIHFGLTKLDLIKDQDVLNQQVNNFRVRILKTFEDQIELLKSQKKSVIDVNMINSYENRKTTVQFFPVSSLNDHGTSEVASFFHDLAKGNKQKIPKHWVKCLKSIKKDKKPFLKHTEFQEYYDKYDPSATTEDSSSTSLRYFSDCGLVIWYEDHPILKHFVFHNIQYLISLMKCVFRHDLVDHLSYDTNTDLKKVFNKTDYKKTMEEFQTQGLLSLKLLTFLWKDEFGAEVENKDEFLELMKCLDICQEVCDKNNEKKYFFPWFVTDEEEPLVVKEMCRTDNSHIMLNLQCIFTPDIPNNVTELMIVHLQRLASEKHYLGDRKAWRDGLYISDSHSEASVLREPKTHSLQIYVKDKVGEIMATWKDFLKLKDSLLEILSQWHGIEESIHIPCVHCIFLKKSEPKLWPVEDVFGTGREKVYTSCSGDKEVPAALVTMINTGDDDGKKHIQAVQDFLRSNSQESSGGSHQPHSGAVTTLSLHEPHSSQSEGPEKKRLKTMTEEDDDVIPPQDDSQGLHGTAANYKLNPQQSQFVLDQIIPSICRINIPGFSGTGFVLGALQDPGTGQTHRYVLTCYHIKLFAALRDQQYCEAQFDRSNAAAVKVKILQAPLYWSQDMDFVLVKLEASQALDNSLAGKVSLGQLVTVNIPAHNDALVLCAHTSEQQIDWGARALAIDDESVRMKHGDLTEINVRRKRTYRDPNIYPLSRRFILYQCSCQAGTSGAPCLSASQTQLFAMHCGSVYKGTVEMSPEYGVLLKYVVHDIHQTISNPTSVPGSSYMQQGGLQLSDLYCLFPNVPRNLNPASDQVTTMQV